jgi:hypothetical protein
MGKNISMIKFRTKSNNQTVSPQKTGYKQLPFSSRGTDWYEEVKTQ